ncbi:MAG: PAS domain-containing protein, partial [Bacteroidia bacterium]
MQFLSDGCYQITGYKPNDLINNNKISFSDIIHPEDRLLTEADVYFAIKNKTSFEIEYRIITKHKKTIWVWEKGVGVYDEKGKLKYIEGFIIDISERKEYEKEINQKWLDHKNLVEKMPVGVFIHDQGKIVFSNQQAMKSTGIE